VPTPQGQRKNAPVLTTAAAKVLFCPGYDFNVLYLSFPHKSTVNCSYQRVIPGSWSAEEETSIPSP